MFEDNTRLVFWQHHQEKAGFVVEYIIVIEISSSSDYNSHIIKLTSVKDTDLTNAAKRTLKELQQTTKRTARVKFEGKLRLMRTTFGQTHLVIAGQLGAEENASLKERKVDTESLIPP